MPTLGRRVIRWCALLQPAAKECGSLCQVPIGKNFASHREHRPARAAGVEAALSQPLLIFVRLGIVPYRLFQYGALEIQPDRVWCGVALASPPAALCCIQGGKETATDLRRTHYRSAAWSAETPIAAADDSRA